MHKQAIREALAEQSFLETHVYTVAKLVLQLNPEVEEFRSSLVSLSDTRLSCIANLMYRPTDVKSISLHLYRERLATKFKRYLVGDGMWIFHCLSQRFSHVVGVDVIKNVFWSVRPRNVDFIVCDAMHLPFVDRAFDLCFLDNIWHHVKMPLIILKRVKECVKSTLIVIEANRYNLIGGLQS